MDDTAAGASTGDDITVLAYHQTRLAQWRMQTLGLAIAIGTIVGVVAALVFGLAGDASVGALGLALGPLAASTVMALASAPTPLD